MKPDAGRVAAILVLVAIGWLFWATPDRHRAYMFWSLAAVYAILTSHKRWI